MIRDRHLATLDLNFLGTALVIAAVGLLLIYSATYFTDPGLGTVKKQALWVAIGICLMFVFLFIDYHVFFDLAPYLYAVGIVLLIYLLVWGRATAHVKSWIHIGGFQFQPAEFMKIFTALMLARYFDSNDRAYLNFRSFATAMGIIALPVGLIIVQPDFGTAATFAPLAGVVMFFGGIRLRYWLILILIGLDRFRRHSRQRLQAGYTGQARIPSRATHRLHLRRRRRRVGLHRRRHHPRALSILHLPGVDVRETRQRSWRYIPRDLPHLVLHLPHPDQHFDADRSAAHDGHSAAADLVWRLVDDDVLHRDRADFERGYAAVRERLALSLS